MSTLREEFEISTPSHNIQTVRKLAAQVRTGDDYMRTHDISSIDFLEIDVGGAEMSALAGFSDAFAERRIELVQFEYGEINLGTRVLLRDFYDFFSRHGFVVGKIYPDGVAFKPYETFDEDFTGPNYLARPASRHELIGALCCPPLESWSHGKRNA